MRDVACRGRRLRRLHLREVAMLGVVAGVAFGLFVLRERAGATPSERPVPSAAFSLSDTAVPDDLVLQEQLEKAIDLRRREFFDRVLDARDPGELIEHATLTETALDRRILGI